MKGGAGVVTSPSWWAWIAYAPPCKKLAVNELEPLVQRGVRYVVWSATVEPQGRLAPSVKI